MGEVVYLNNVDENGKRGAGSITRNKGSKKLYVKFYYFGRPVEKSTGLDDTPENRVRARNWLDRQLDKIDEGAFRFSEAFPRAREEEKRFFTEKEGWQYSPEPQTILFEDYVTKWKAEIWSQFDSEIKKQDFEQVMDDWLLPHFGRKTFFQITAVEIKKFLATLKWRSGKNKGKKLSRSRIKNVFIPMRAIWNDACRVPRAIHGCW